MHFFVLTTTDYLQMEVGINKNAFTLRDTETKATVTGPGS